MYVIPAIDLLGGKCVRLIQGDYRRQITYRDNPAEQAEQFIAEGALWLHIVDLDGARVGKSVNTDSVSAIAALGQVKIEVGGGIRDEASIRQLLDIGAERLIIGTKAVSDFEWFSEMANKFSGETALSGDNIYRHYQRRNDVRAELRENKGPCRGRADSRYSFRRRKRSSQHHKAGRIRRD